jgi:hypothetical protein
MDIFQRLLKGGISKSNSVSGAIPVQSDNGYAFHRLILPCLSSLRWLSV